MAPVLQCLSTSLHGSATQSLFREQNDAEGQLMLQWREKEEHCNAGVGSEIMFHLLDYGELVTKTNGKSWGKASPSKHRTVGSKQLVRSVTSSFVGVRGKWWCYCNSGWQVHEEIRRVWFVGFARFDFLDWFQMFRLLHAQSLLLRFNDCDQGSCISDVKHQVIWKVNQERKIICTMEE